MEDEEINHPVFKDYVPYSIYEKGRKENRRLKNLIVMLDTCLIFLAVILLVVIVNRGW